MSASQQDQVLAPSAGAGQQTNVNIEELARKIYEAGPQGRKTISNEGLDLLLSTISQFDKTAVSTSDPHFKYLQGPHPRLAARLGCTCEELIRLMDCVLRCDSEASTAGRAATADDAIQKCQAERLQILGKCVSENPESVKHLCDFMHRTGWLSDNWQPEERRRPSRKRAATPALDIPRPEKTVKTGASKRGQQKKKSSAAAVLSSGRATKRRKVQSATAKSNEVLPGHIEQQPLEGPMQGFGEPMQIDETTHGEADKAKPQSDVQPGPSEPRVKDPNGPDKNQPSTNQPQGSSKIASFQHPAPSVPPSGPSAHLDPQSQPPLTAQAQVSFDPNNPSTISPIPGGGSRLSMKLPFAADLDGYRNGIKLDSIIETIGSELQPSLEQEVESFVRHASVFQDAAIDFGDTAIADLVGLAHGRADCSMADLFKTTEKKEISALAIISAMIVQNVISGDWPEAHDPIRAHEKRIEDQLVGPKNALKWSTAKLRLLMADETYREDMNKLATVAVEQQLRKIHVVNNQGWKKNLYELGLRLGESIEYAVEAALKIRIGYGPGRVGAVWLQAGQKVPRNMRATFFHGFGAPIAPNELPDDAVVCYTLQPAIVDTGEAGVSAESGCFIRTPAEGLLLDRMPKDARLLVPPHLIVYSEELGKKLQL